MTSSVAALSAGGQQGVQVQATFPSVGVTGGRSSPKHRPLRSGQPPGATRVRQLSPTPHALLVSQTARPRSHLDPRPSRSHVHARRFLCPGLVVTSRPYSTPPTRYRHGHGDDHRCRAARPTAFRDAAGVMEPGLGSSRAVPSTPWPSSPPSACTSWWTSTGRRRARAGETEGKGKGKGRGKGGQGQGQGQGRGRAGAREGEGGVTCSGRS